MACDQDLGILIFLRYPGRKTKAASIPRRAVGENVYSEQDRGIYLISQLEDLEWYERGDTEIHIREN